jgi:hypothetical protein
VQRRGHVEDLKKSHGAGDVEWHADLLGPTA